MKKIYLVKEVTYYACTFSANFEEVEVGEELRVFIANKEVAESDSMVTSVVNKTYKVTSVEGVHTRASQLLKSGKLSESKTLLLTRTPATLIVSKLNLVEFNK